ncbi:hypothetical protein DL96DRAFT_1533646 [Flagelloscypha sp. PMI_526]|nr:hypothetical protein DL96DRAFT_1533646 [Flagelloscypha sp. PMI_526]
MSTTLCLACSSSFPPNVLSKGAVYQTPCCSRPICSSCTTANPRLMRYNPCLSCLSGVGVLASSSLKETTLPGASAAPPDTNLNGAIRDSDNFQIGDDSDEEDQDSPRVSQFSSSSNPTLNAPPSYTSGRSSASSLSLSESSLTASSISELQLEPPQAPVLPSTSTGPSKYYLQKGDSLQGLALRFGVSGRELCSLNKLPPSTLTTTPHLLHTRASIILPLTARIKPTDIVEQIDPEREAELTRERAEKKLQTLTKEVDWKVAKAYVALAESATDEDVERFDLKQKELSVSGLEKGKGRLESMAVDAYLEDDEWERMNPFRPGGAWGSSKSASSSQAKGWFKKTNAMSV